MKILYCYEDAEESVNDTYMTAWSTIPPQKPSYLFAYLAKICRFKSYEKIDWKTAKKRQAKIVELTAEMETCISSNPSEESKSEYEEIGHLLNKFLASLSEEKRLIFMRRYWYSTSSTESTTQPRTLMQTIRRKHPSGKKPMETN